MLKFNLNVKINLGFGIIIVLAILMGGIGYFFVKTVDREIGLQSEFSMPIERTTSAMEQAAREITLGAAAFLAYGDYQHLRSAASGLAALRAANTQLEELQNKFPLQTASIAEDTRARRQAIDQLEANLRNLEEIGRRNDSSRADVLAATETAAAELKKFSGYMQELLHEEIAGGLLQELPRRLERKDFADEGVLLLERSMKIFWNAIAKRDYGAVATLKAPLQELLTYTRQVMMPDTKRARNLESLTIFADNLEILLNAVELDAQDSLALRETIAALTQATDDAMKYTDNAFRFANQATVDSNSTLVKDVTSAETYITVITFLIFLLALLVAWRISAMISRPVKAITSAFALLVKKDFRVQFSPAMLTRKDEMGTLVRELEEVCAVLSQTINLVREDFERVSYSAAELKEDNDELNNRTQQQAAAVEQISSSLAQIAGAVKESASNSQHANTLALKTSQTARQGGSVLSRTVDAMREVTESSKKINDIITVVNEIAFQTNLLALNAAVEAARAGEAGRGFAVVAGEVRNLAGRSAQAAKEIQTLITDSVNKVEHSNQLVGESGELLSAIIADAEAVVGTISEISGSAQEQASAIEEINKAMTQMDSGVQQNAAMVEEIASATEQLNLAANNAHGQVSQFITQNQTLQPALLSYQQ
ncbi:MAG: methyl-accepting chemotaxis protein [Desulfarculales bacterium]|jgi:methyl-accepting chemotaxis protein|nr:methyl-accepting chemotaxis protein [Desulfarculales bacterium]